MKTETHTISFSELAMRYFPNSTKESARRQLNRWIQLNVSLTAHLVETGYSAYNHRLLTPLQYSYIVRFLGEP